MDWHSASSFRVEPGSSCGTRIFVWNPGVCAGRGRIRSESLAFRGGEGESERSVFAGVKVSL